MSGSIKSRMIRSYSVLWTSSIRSVSVPGHVDRVTGAFQSSRQELLDAFFVLYNEDSHSFRLWTQCSIGPYF